MSRPYRLEAENCFYHITSRGDRRNKIYQIDSDYSRFLKYLQIAEKRYKYNLYAYVLMPNHYHLLIETLQANLSKIMHYINSSYTTYFNIRHRKVGHLFQGRYKSIIVDKDSYFLELTRYIHLNPVRAGMVKSPEEYKWTSYNSYIGREDNKYIDNQEIEKVMDLDNKEYKKFAMAGMGKDINPFKDVYGGIILGKTGFIKRRLNDIKEYVEGREFSHRKELGYNISCEEVLSLIEKKYGKDLNDLRKRTRKTRERNIAIYLMRELSGSSNREIGELLDMKFSSVSKAAVGLEKDMQRDIRLKNEVSMLISNFEA